MKHITTIILLINGLLLSSAVQGQNQQKGQNKRFGAPNSVQSQGQKNRQTVRQPLGSEANLGLLKMRKKGGEQGSKKGPQSGMTKGKKGEPIESIVKALKLDPEQAKKLKAARQEMGATAKNIRENGELSEGEKKEAFREAHIEQQKKLTQFLSKQQVAKLRAINSNNAKPGPQGRPQGGGEEQGRPQRRPESLQLNDPRVSKALGITGEQHQRLKRVREAAAKKIKAIQQNEDLTKEQKQQEIESVHSTVRARSNSILTVEQQAQLKELRAAANQRRQQGGGQEQGRPQQGSQKGGQKGRPQQGGQKGGQKGRPQDGGQKGGQKGRPQRPQDGGQEKGRPQRRPQTQDR